MKFIDWLGHEGHMQTFVALNIKEIDEERPCFTDPVQLAVNEAKRRLLRDLAVWRPKDEQEVKQQAHTNLKAGEYFAPRK